MTSELSFCEQCNTLLPPLPELDSGDAGGFIGVKLRCTNCPYEKKVDGNHVVYSHNIKSKANTSSIDMATIYDSAVKRTSRVSCPVPECKANNPEHWGSLNENGIVIQPDIMVINYNDSNRVSTYLCRTCGNVSKVKA